MVGMGRRGALVGIALMLVAGCGTDHLDRKSDFRAPAGGKKTQLTFTDPQELSMFDNPASKEPAGFTPGEWRIEGGALKQTMGMRDNTANHLRYKGDAFGRPDGQAGQRYRVDVDASAYQQADHQQVHGFPTGVLNLMPYYQDPTHYVMLVAKKQTIEAWVADGQRPASMAWPDTNKLWGMWLKEPIAIGQVFKLGAEVDTESKLLRIYVNDELKAERQIPMISTDAPHWVALGANGNYAQYDNLTLQWLK